MLSKFHEKQNEEGFTLIELLVVIIIIGILAAIAIPTFLGQRERARRGAVQSDLRNMAINAETYFTDTQSYADFTLGTEWTTFSPSTGVILTGFYKGQGFCVNGLFYDAANTDLLPDADGGGWYYKPTASPQLQNFTDAGGGCADGVDGFTIGGGAVLDGRNP